MTQWVKDAWDKLDYKTDNCLLNIKVSVCAKCAGLPSRSPDTHCQPSDLERACWPGPLPGTHVALWNSAMKTSPSQTCYLIGTRLWSVGQWRYFLFSSSRLSPSPSPWSPALVIRLQSSLCSWGSLGDWEESLLLVSQVSRWRQWQTRVCEGAKPQTLLPGEEPGVGTAQWCCLWRSLVK